MISAFLLVFQTYARQSISPFYKDGILRTRAVVIHSHRLCEPSDAAALKEKEGINKEILELSVRRVSDRKYY